MTNSTGNLGQDLLAWFFALFTAVAGFSSLERWALITGIVCTIFTTVSSYLSRKATLKATLATLAASENK